MSYKQNSSRLRRLPDFFGITDSSGLMPLSQIRDNGVINNTPSVDELEEKAKRGEVISLSALAAAVKAEDGRTPQRDPDGKKPSIRAQLKADRAQSCKPQQREKEQEAKRSIRQVLEME